MRCHSYCTGPGETEPEPEGGDECNECQNVGYTKEHRGIISDKVKFELENDKTWAECAKLCDAKTDERNPYEICHRFTYHSESKTCYLLNARVFDYWKYIIIYNIIIKF